MAYVTIFNPKGAAVSQLEVPERDFLLGADFDAAVENAFGRGAAWNICSGHTAFKLMSDYEDRAWYWPYSWENTDVAQPFLYEGEWYLALLEPVPRSFARKAPSINTLPASKSSETEDTATEALIAGSIPQFRNSEWCWKPGCLQRMQFVQASLVCRIHGPTPLGKL